MAKSNYGKSSGEIGEQKGARKRNLPVWPIGPSRVSPSIKLGEIAASLLPRVIISPKFWNLVAKRNRLNSYAIFLSFSKSIEAYLLQNIPHSMTYKIPLRITIGPSNSTS
jgi:hypothetical protein